MSKGNRLTLLQLGGSKAFFTDVTFYGYFFFLVIVLQDKMYFLISSWHCSLFVVLMNLVSLVVICCCKMRVHAATLDVSDLPDPGILKNDFLFSKLYSYDIDDFLPVEANILYSRPQIR